MKFFAQLIQLRRERGLPQQQLADAAGINVNQIKRCEAGTTQPILEALVKQSKSLHTSLDTLVFGDISAGRTIQSACVSPFQLHYKKYESSVMA
jgi:transcriptional regulator with XRE-family HTH domain